MISMALSGLAPRGRRGTACCCKPHVATGRDLKEKT